MAAQTSAAGLHAPDGNGRQRVAARRGPSAPSQSSEAIQEAARLPAAENDALTEAARHYRAAMTSAPPKPAPPTAATDPDAGIAAETAPLIPLSPASPMSPFSPERPRSRTADEMLAAAIEAAPRLKLWLPPEGETSASSSPDHGAITEREPAPMAKPPSGSMPSEPPTPEDIFTAGELTPEFVSEQRAEACGDGRPALPPEVFAAADMAAAEDGSTAAMAAAVVEHNVAERTPDDPAPRMQALVAEAPLLLPADAPDAPPAEKASAPMQPPAHHAARARSEAEARAFLTPLGAGEEDRPAPAVRHNLRKSAGLIAFAAILVLALAAIVLWRSGDFQPAPPEASIKLSPEAAVIPAAGGDADGTALQSADLAGNTAASPLVRDTELLLEQLDFEPGPVDGVLDDATRAAIRRYQQTAGLPETGEPSPELLDELTAVAAAMQGNAN
ncbi:MAG: peptidoglycan-binding domain-containing protein [Pseudomonadota bacterium]